MNTNKVGTFLVSIRFVFVMLSIHLVEIGEPCASKSIKRKKIVHGSNITDKAGFTDFTYATLLCTSDNPLTVNHEIKSAEQTLVMQCLFVLWDLPPKYQGL